MSSETILFTRGVPAVESFAVERIAEAAATATREHGAALLQYGKSSGFLPLRERLAAQYECGVEGVLLSNGSLQIIDFTALALLEAGDTVLVESPTYDRTLTLLRRHGANVVGVPLTAEGPDLDAVERILDSHRPRLFYTIPDFQNPSGATASMAVRERLAELARQHDFWLLEDAPYRPLRYRGEQRPALRDLAPDRTLHMSSYTKQIAPGLRVGYVVGPAAPLARLARAAEDTYITPNLIGQGIVNEFLDRGWLAPQLANLRALYGPRLNAVGTALHRFLPDTEWIEPDGGFFLSVTLPPGVSNEALRGRALEEGLVLADGRAFFPNPADGERFVRLPFCALDERELEEGVRRLARAVDALVSTPA